MKMIILIVSLSVVLSCTGFAQCYYYNNNAKYIINSHNTQVPKLYDNDTTTSEIFLVKYRITEAIYNYDQQGTDAYHFYYVFPQDSTILKVGEYSNEIPHKFYIYVMWSLKKQIKDLDYSAFYHSLFMKFMDIPYDMHTITKSPVTFLYDINHLNSPDCSPDLIYTQTTWDTLGDIGWLYEKWGQGFIQHKFINGAIITDTIKVNEYYVWADDYKLYIDSIFKENINDNVKDGTNIRRNGDSLITLDRQISLVNNDTINKIMTDNFLIEYQWLLNGNIVSDSAHLNLSFKYTAPFTLTYNIKLTKTVYLFNGDFCTDSTTHKINFNISTGVIDEPKVEAGGEIIGYYNYLGQKIQNINDYNGLYLEVYKKNNKYFTHKLYK